MPSPALATVMTTGMVDAAAINATAVRLVR
jgi:hypothetical protein